jgi:hypothetical protein
VGSWHGGLGALRQHIAVGVAGRPEGMASRLSR